MKRFRSADAAVYAWHAAQSAAHAARGQAFGQSGRDYAPRCANRRCGRAGTRITTYPKGVPTVRCGACGTPWEYSEALVPAGVFRSGKGGRAPGRVELAASLEVVIESLYRTDDLEPGEAGVYVGWLVKGSKTWDDVARDASRKEFAGRLWDRNDVRRAVTRCRSWLEGELERRGLLQLEVARFAAVA